MESRTKKNVYHLLEREHLNVVEEAEDHRETWLRVKSPRHKVCLALKRITPKLTPCHSKDPRDVQILVMTDAGKMTDTTTLRGAQAHVKKKIIVVSVAEVGVRVEVEAEAEAEAAAEEIENLEPRITERIATNVILEGTMITIDVIDITIMRVVTDTETGMMTVKDIAKDRVVALVVLVVVDVAVVLAARVEQTPLPCQTCFLSLLAAEQRLPTVYLCTV
jgi:hypothetical protein